MEDDLVRLFSSQGSCFDLKEYQNEFETMRLLFDYLPEKPKQLVRELSLLWLQNLEQNENIEFDLKDNNEKCQESEDLRKRGNRLFTAKGDKRNILGACRLYNDAIYAALDTKGDALALGFANRATGLQSFGYYQQAYDDCVCAMELGYPELLRHKIIIRQAYCSIKMEDLKRSEKHITELQKLNLSAGFSKEFNELLVAFDRLKDKSVNWKDTNENEAIDLNRETQEIITTGNGRCMQTKCDIGKNQLIFTERASAFVAVGDTRRLCHQCGTVNFIPIPCLHCRGRVNYCSLKCKEEHIEVHVYECPAYRFQLFAHIGIAHLALRIVLDNGLLSIADDIRFENQNCTIEVWRAMNEDCDIWKNNGMQYSQSFRMITHLNKMAQREIEWYALVSHLLVVYLKHYTNYFDALCAKNKKVDWELLTGSLILRHIGQCISNGHTLTAIIPKSLTLMTTTDFHMLNENVWSSPWHLKLGFLHFFANYDDVASLNLPYLSLCNHSCVQLFQNKFSGRFISTYALRHIGKGEEITNCYDVDHRKSKRVNRRKRLQETYHFDCRCENCTQTDNEDVEFNKFYQYRCDNTKCGQIFVSSTPEVLTFDFVQSELSDSKMDMNLSCTICGHRQALKWYYESINLLNTFAEAGSRRRLYKIFRESEKYLIDLNKARCFLGQVLVHEWFTIFWTNDSLNDDDYCGLIEVLKYILNVTRKRSSINSIEYIIYMIYLWDLMAKRKYKCAKGEMEEMLYALTIVSDDVKLIFLNYYSDYIKDYLSF